MNPVSITLLVQWMMASAMVICTIVLGCDVTATFLKWTRRRQIIEFCDAATSFDGTEDASTKLDSVNQLNAGYGDYRVFL